LNTLAAVVAIASTSLAIGCRIRMRGVDARLENQDFPHRKWDIENPISYIHWNSKGEPIFVSESRSLENSLTKTGGSYYLASGIFSAIAVLAWIATFGY